MLREFDMYPGLEVVLIGPPEPKHVGHKIRAVASQNPPRYRRFTNQYCTVYGKDRRARPNFINKTRVETALQKIIDNRADGVYCERLLEWINRELFNEDSRKQSLKCTTDYMPF